MLLIKLALLFIFYALELYIYRGFYKFAWSYYQPILKLKNVGKGPFKIV